MYYSVKSANVYWLIFGMKNEEENKNDTIAQQTLFEPKNMKKDPNKIWNEKIEILNLALLF